MRKQIRKKEARIVPGLLKIFDEILVNAADNKRRDPQMTTIAVNIDRLVLFFGSNNCIRVPLSVILIICLEFPILFAFLAASNDSKHFTYCVLILSLYVDFLFRERNTISVWNNGRGIPVEVHPTEGIYVPTMIFGTLFTSSNYDDSELKIVG